MLKIRTLKVLDENGQEETLKLVPAALIAAENYARNLDSNAREMLYETTMYAGWTVAKRTGKTSLDFNEWVATLVAVEEAEETFQVDRD